MSLINEALKKAQHQRTGSALDNPPMPGGGSGSGRGGSSMPTGTLVLLIAGAVVVVVISVVATVYFVNRPTASKDSAAPVVASPTVAATKPAPAPEPSPVIIAPVIVHAPPPPVELPAPPPTVVETETPPAAAVTPAAEPAVVEGSLADRITTYVEKVRVTGIRTSDSGSKVLMNDRVYRVNDIVDRKLGLRLIKISPGSLTFADATGATYVKDF